MRRAEARKHGGGGWVARLRGLLGGQIGWRTAVVGITLVTGVAYLTAAESDRLPYRLRERIAQPILARVAFSRLDQTETNRRIQKARRAAPNYYRLNEALQRLIDGELSDLLAAVTAAESFEKFAESGANRRQLSSEAFEAVSSLKQQEAAPFETMTAALRAAVASTPMVQPPTPAERPATEADHAVLEGLTPEETVSRSRLWYASNPEHVELIARRITSG
ncbi:MAG: hypothetical protein V3T70_01430, partial [Phycisphaerae bacterium]